MSKTTHTIQEHARQLVRTFLPALEASKSEPDMEGKSIKSVYLGSCLHLYPSGKFYLPFACSNLDTCACCRGRGTLPNPHASLTAYNRSTKLGNRLRKVAITRHGFFCKGRWPDGLLARLATLDRRATYHQPSMPCSTCAGLGSRDAYLDQVWQEALEGEAAIHGCYITGSEGDGCDVVLAKAVETSEPDNESENAAALTQCIG